MSRPFLQFPSDLDWTRSDLELAAQLGCSRQAVTNGRQRLGKPKPARKPGTGKAAVVDITQFHLGWSNGANAKRLGCTQTWAAALRRKIMKEKKAKEMEEWGL